ncbi:MAG: hypothetical protein VB878_17300 [Pirellulaceae bacterium]
MRDVGEQWGDQPESNDKSRFCLRCQEPLCPLEGMAFRCQVCGKTYSPVDPATFRPERVYVSLTFWLPALLASSAIAIVSLVVAFALEAGMVAVLAIFPAPLGLLAGYVHRPTLLIVIQLVVGAMFAAVSMYGSGSVFAFLGAFCSGMFVIVPTALGYVLGLLLRTQLQRSRWDQRWFL